MANWFQLWWSDWPAFFRMGHHGFYVWSSVAVVIVALAGEQIALLRRAHRVRREGEL